MGQNNNINERSMDSKFDINKNDNNNNNNTYCAKCLKELDSEDRDIVKDVDNNLFCDRWCMSEFLRENYKLIEEVIGGF